MNSNQFLESAYEIFLVALAKNELISRFYRLAGFTFCLKFAGEKMVIPLTTALEHLEIPPVDCPQLTICIWDSVSTMTPTLHFPWQYTDIRGEVFGFNCETIHTVLDIHTKVLNVFDKERMLALYWIKDWRDLPWWIGGSPFQLVLHWWMRSQGLQLTHAAAVGTSKGGVLLAGKSGSGKSTTALSCMKAGMKYVSEDYCLLSDLPEIQSHCVYNSAKIGEKTLTWFPELEKHIENRIRAKSDKAFIFHQKFQPEKILSSCPVKAIVALTVADTAESRLEPIAPSDAVAALSISTMWQLTHTGPTVFKHLKRVTESLPCFRLNLGFKIEHAPELIGKIL